MYSIYFPHRRLQQASPVEVESIHADGISVITIWGNRIFLLLLLYIFFNTLCSQGKIRTASQRSIVIINHTPQKAIFEGKIRLL